LKFLSGLAMLRQAGVAPRAGAWIEMFMSKMGKRSWRVAPRAGAWIEMKYYGGNYQDNKVAPRAGAWIEISQDYLKQQIPRSRPARARGLKYIIASGCVDYCWSRPARARGLKW